MKQFFAVFEFEFLGFIRATKSWIPTIIIAVISIILAVLPLAINFFTNSFGDDEIENIGVFFEAENLKEYEEIFEGEFEEKYIFVESYSQLMDGLSNKTYSNAFYFSKDGLITYNDSLSIMDINDNDKFVNSISDIVTDNILKQSDYYLEYENYMDYLSDYTSQKFSVVDGVVSFEENDTSSMFLKVFTVYFFIILIYMLVSQYSSSVIISVANEKTSKTMESLISSTDTNSLVFGKVFAVFCASVLQVILILSIMFVCTNIGTSNLNLLQDSAGSYSGIEMIYLGINQIFDVKMILYFLFLTFTGFLMYLFIFAALASTVTKMEDVNSSVQVGTLIFMFGFFDAIAIILSPMNKIITGLAYFPLFTPLSMMAKYASGIASNFDIIYSVVISILSVVFFGFFAGRVYKVGVLYYGSKPSFKKILKMFIFNK